MAVEYITSGNDDGSVMGQSTSDKIAFYNTTTIVQPTNSNQAAVTAASAQTTTGTTWGYATSTQADGIVTLLNRIRTDLVSLGLIKGS